MAQPRNEASEVSRRTKPPLHPKLSPDPLAPVRRIGWPQEQLRPETVGVLDPQPAGPRVLLRG